MIERMIYPLILSTETMTAFRATEEQKLRAQQLPFIPPPHCVLQKATARSPSPSRCPKSLLPSKHRHWWRLPTVFDYHIRIRHHRMERRHDGRRFRSARSRPVRCWHATSSLISFLTSDPTPPLSSFLEDASPPGTVRHATVSPPLPSRSAQSSLKLPLCLCVLVVLQLPTQTHG